MSILIPQDDKLLPKWLAQRLVVDQPLEPGSKLYEPIYENDPNDPITLIKRDIEFNEVESLNFISGFRGSGKTTELFRLRKMLRNDGHYVVYANALDYLPPSEPVEISDFLIVLAGSFSDALASDQELKYDPVKEGWWTRIVNFLQRTNVNLEGFEVKAGAKAAQVAEIGLNLKASLKQAPSFRQKLREKMTPRLAELRKEVQLFFSDSIRRVKVKTKTEQTLAFIFDNLEQLRDTLGKDSPVADSVTSLIANHTRDLKIPSVHCVYTVPPWLKFKLPGMASIRLLYNVKLWKNDPSRTPDQDGLSTMRRIVSKRFTEDGIKRFFGDLKTGKSKRVDKLIDASGGHFRDLILLLRECVLRSRALPVDDTIVEASINNLRSSYLPIPIKDAKWLNEISLNQESLMLDKSSETVHQMTFFLDTHCIMIYRNGEEWYDVHPIIRDEIKEIVRRDQTPKQ